MFHILQSKPQEDRSLCAVETTQSAMCRGGGVHSDTTLTQHWVPGMVGIVAWNPHVLASCVYGRWWTSVFGTPENLSWSSTPQRCCNSNPNFQWPEVLLGFGVGWRLLVPCIAPLLTTPVVHLLVFVQVNWPPHVLKRLPRSMPCLVTLGPAVVISSFAL